MTFSIMFSTLLADTGQIVQLTLGIVGAVSGLAGVIYGARATLTAQREANAAKAVESQQSTDRARMDKAYEVLSGLVDDLREEVSRTKGQSVQDIAALRADHEMAIAGVRAEVDQLRGDLTSARSDLAHCRKRRSELERELAQMRKG